MRAYILFSALMVYFQVESNVMFCDICDCQEITEPLTGVVVNCSFHERVLEMNPILPDASITLDLSRSNLTSVQPTSIFQSETLVELLLNRNFLKEINLLSFNLPELKQLDLSENELKHFDPDSFNGFTKLEYLNLASNKFTVMSQLNFNSLVNLREIILDNNNIGDDIETKSLFDEQGYGLPLSIQSISISGINLDNLNLEYFKPVEKTLKKLVISNNNLNTIVKLPQWLEYLDYSNNPIKKITTEEFEPLVYLKELKLNNLDIEEIPKNVFATLILTNLELKNNKKLKEFSNLSFGRQILSDTYDFLLENLSLKGSNLSTLDESLSVLFVKVKRLDLQQNPWVCDCRLAWLRKLPIAPDLIDDLKCSSPQNLIDRRIFDLGEEDFVCDTSSWDESQFGLSVGHVIYLLLALVTISYLSLYNTTPKDNLRQK
ncbi:leucine-rich repeat-containing protein 70-like [Vanessa cardui]|uniref:leucine-rich repeat-containing protein 70-like n=1 Tax=Vanessa cardui TaxID=171605 RepID=UPI001F13506C|nr:leucine-rich repeat-containing protein 70-like [Vanessa cardui]